MTTEEYHIGLKIARSLNRAKNTLFDEYDVIHETILQYGFLNVNNIKRVYFSFLSISTRSNKSLRSLPTEKLCKGCSPNYPIPIMCFYILENKNGTLRVNTLCKSCCIKKAILQQRERMKNEEYKKQWYRKWNIYRKKRYLQTKGKVRKYSRKST